MINRYEEITNYINDNIYHSSVWDEAEDTQRKKAINNSIAILLNILSDYYTADTDITTDVIAQQTVWFMRIDDTFLRAEMGISYIQMSGVMLTITDKDRSIAPYVLDKLNISPDAITKGFSRRKVGRYSGRIVGTPESILRKEQ